MGGIFFLISFGMCIRCGYHGMGGKPCLLFPCTPVPCVASCIRRKNTYVSDVELKIAAATEVVRVGNVRLGWTDWDARKSRI